MAIMTVCSLVFNMGGVDGNTTGLLFWSFVDLVVVREPGTSLFCKYFGDSGSQRSLSVINVACQFSVQKEKVALLEE